MPGRDAGARAGEFRAGGADRRACVEPAAVSPQSRPGLTVGLADRFAQLALANVAREYPTKLDHVINGPDDVRPPSELHPLFHGSFDWHSCVHAHWMLARSLR